MIQHRQRILYIFIALMIITAMPSCAFSEEAVRTDRNGTAVNTASSAEETLPGGSEETDLSQLSTWILNTIHYPQAQRFLEKAAVRTVRVAVLDSPVNYESDELKPYVLPQYAVNAASSDFRHYEAKPEYSANHGHQMARNVALVANGGRTGSRASAYIMPIQITKERQTTGRHVSNHVVARAIRYAVDHGASVINMSFGHGPANGDIRDDDDRLKKAVNYAREHGVTLVASAGNFNTDAAWYPSDLNHVISVIAVDQYTDPAANPRAAYSNYGRRKTISAPAGKLSRPLMQIRRKNGDIALLHSYNGGTSSAAATTSGIVAAMYSVNQYMTPVLARKILCNTATDVYEKGFDSQTAAGIVNESLAVRKSARYARRTARRRAARIRKPTHAKKKPVHTKKKTTPSKKKKTTHTERKKPSRRRKYTRYAGR